MKKLLSLFIFLCLVMACDNQQNTSLKTQTTNNAPINREVKPIFNVEDLVGKNQVQVDKILGKPSEFWNMSSDPTRQMREYPVGESLSMIFYKGRIETLTFFFGSPQPNPEAAFLLCGLRLNDRVPDFNTGESKIYENFLIKNTSARIAVSEDWIKFEFWNK